MRKMFPCFIALSLFFAGCMSTENKDISEGNRWKLIETRVSPGGHVEFTPTDEVEYIEFKNNEVWKENGWCGEGSPEVVKYDEDGTILQTVIIPEP